MAEKRRATKIDAGVTLIKGIDFECCIWLVEGSERALLIDTGLGLGNLREEVEELTSLPLLVVNTHGHFDHSGGNYRFDEVLMHEKAWPESQLFLENLHFFTSPEELAEIKRLSEEKPNKVKFLKEGDIIDLGDRKLKVIETPGHTPGDITLFDSSSGLLFSGDCMLKAMDVLLVVPQTVSVACYAESIRKLVKLDNVTGFCSGHDMCIMPPSFMKDCADCADGILAGTASVFEVESGLPDGEKTCMRATMGDAAILYRSNKIR